MTYIDELFKDDKPKTEEQKQKEKQDEKEATQEYDWGEPRGREFW